MHAGSGRRAPIWSSISPALDIRPAAPAGLGASAGPRYQRLPDSGAAPQGAGPAGEDCSRTGKDRQKILGYRRRARRTTMRKAESTCRCRRSLRKDSIGACSPTPPGNRPITDYRVMGKTDGGLTWVEFQTRKPAARTRSAYMPPPSAARSWATPIYGRPDPAIPLNLHSRGVTVPLYPTKDAVMVTGAAAAAYDRGADSMRLARTMRF